MSAPSVSLQIYFGLLAVRNVGAGFIREIERERETGGEFKSFYSFCKRMQDKEFNKRAVESLIKCGALDGLGANRRQMLYAFPEISAQLENDRRRNIDGQLGFFDAAPSEAPQGEYRMPTLEEIDKRELLKRDDRTLPHGSPHGGIRTARRAPRLRQYGGSP